MTVARVILNPPGYPDPINPEMKPVAESGNLHRIYLLPNPNTLITNGGGIGTTDWTSPTAGLAQYWDTVHYP